MALYKAWSRNIKENLIDILENLDPAPVVEFAVSQNGLSAEEADDIMSEPTPKTRVKKYLDYLEGVPGEQFRRFVDGVVITGQGHVAGLITGSAQLMTSSHKESLHNNKARLERFINVDPLLTILRSKNVLTSYDKQTIQAQADKYKQNSKLLEVIMRKPDSSYHYFIDALESTGQRHLAGLLLPKEERNLFEEIESLWLALEKTEEVKDATDKESSVSRSLSVSSPETKANKVARVQVWIENNHLKNEEQELSDEAMVPSEHAEPDIEVNNNSESPTVIFEEYRTLKEPTSKNNSRPAVVRFNETPTVQEHYRRVPEIIEHGESPMDRPYLDTQPNAAYILNPNDPITRDGQVMTWKFWARREAKIYFQIWRSFRPSYYTLIGQTEVTVDMPGMQKVNASDSNIFVSKGDFIGFYHPDESVIPFDMAHADMCPVDFNWSASESSMTSGVTLEFNSLRNYWAPSRIYSIGLTLLAF